MGAKTVSGLDTLGYDWSRFSFQSFTAFVGRQKNLSIILCPQQLSPSVFGIWFPYCGRHYLCYDDAPPVMWALVNGLHELGHVALDHTPRDITETLKALRQNVVAGIAPDGPVLGLCKAMGYEDDQEKAAEDWALEVILKLQRNKYPLKLQSGVDQIDILPGTGIA